jgi:hypothetical protein
MIFLLVTAALACNVYNSNFYTNTDLCDAELCSVNGYSNTCASGCCTGSYCQATSACAASVWIPTTIAFILVAWAAFVIVVAYRNAERKR